MRARSVAQVKAMLAAQRRKRNAIISRQSFYCSHLDRAVSPAECHDCFAGLGYLERLTRWSENRMNCVRAHRTLPDDERTAEPAEPGLLDPSRGISSGRRSYHKPKEQPGYSVQGYLSRGLLEFLLDVDVIAERFQIWWTDLADAARERVHTSADAQEMILWFAERLAEFQRAVTLIARRPEETSINKETKEE